MSDENQNPEGTTEEQASLPKPDANNALAAALEKNKRRVGLAHDQVPRVEQPKEAAGMVAGAGEEHKLDDGEKAYLLMSAPCSFVFANGRRVSCADGVLRTSDPDEIKELDAAVKAGNVFPYTGKVRSEYQIAPGSPQDPRLLAMSGGK